MTISLPSASVVNGIDGQLHLSGRSLQLGRVVLGQPALDSDLVPELDQAHPDGTKSSPVGPA